MALGFGGLQFGSDIDVAGALQGISQAIGDSASLYKQATTQVTDLAKEIANLNIDYLKQTAQQSQAVLQPFQQAGASGITALKNLLGVNGAAAQQQAAQNVIGASTGAVQQANINALNSIFGGAFGSQQATQMAVPVQPQNTPLQQMPPQVRQEYEALQNQLGQLSAQGGPGPQSPEAKAVWDKMNALNAPFAAANRQIIQDNTAQQQAYQQQVTQYQQQQQMQAGQGQQAQTQGAGQNSAIMNIMSQLTGVANPGQAAANILNQNPQDYARNLTQTGIGLAEQATDAFRNNTIVNQSLNAMNQLGSQAVQNSAAARGMLNSGNTMSELYNQGQAIAGQYLIPQITSLSNNIIGNVGSAGNAMLQAQQGLATNILGTGASLGSSIANQMLGANASVANNAMNNQLSGLTGMLGAGLSGAQTQAGVLGNLGQGVAQQNTQMANTQSNAILSNAQQQSNALMSNAQLQLTAAQANLRPDQEGIGSHLGAMLGGMAAGGLAMFL